VPSPAALRAALLPGRLQGFRRPAPAMKYGVSVLLLFGLNLLKFESSELIAHPGQWIVQRRYCVRIRINDLRGGCEKDITFPPTNSILDWKEVSDITGDDLWESKSLKQPHNDAGDASFGHLRPWDMLIPRQYETILSAISAQRYQDARVVFQERYLHVHSGSKLKSNTVSNLRCSLCFESLRVFIWKCFLAIVFDVSTVQYCQRMDLTHIAPTLHPMHSRRVPHT
jgi:hypothetical protein